MIPLCDPTNINRSNLTWVVRNDNPNANSVSSSTYNFFHYTYENIISYAMIAQVHA